MEVYRLHDDHALYFLTFSVIDWLPLFVSEQSCLIITDSLNFCHREKHLRINAFVIMPTHLHLILFDAEFNTNRLSETITAFRKFTGRQLADFCKHHMPQSFVTSITQTQRTDRQHQIWQQSKHPEAIKSQGFWQSKFDYLHDNPRRKGLVRDPLAWRFSSAAYWLQNPPGSSDVILSAVEW